MAASLPEQGNREPLIQIRLAEPEDGFALARVMINATRSAFLGRVPDPCMNWIDVHESARNWTRTIESIKSTRGEGNARGAREEIWVAEIAGRDVVALILAGRRSSEVVTDNAIVERFPAEVSAIQVDPVWQRCGLGVRMIRVAEAFISKQGVSSMLVRVLEDNPNVPFYLSLGGAVLGAQPYDWAGYATRELIVGWTIPDSAGEP